MGGWYAVKEDMHITFICYWAMMSFVNGVFDLVKVVDHVVKSPLPLFSKELPVQYNLMSATIVLIPVVTLAGALLGWRFYKDATELDTVADARPVAQRVNAPYCSTEEPRTT